MNSLMNSPIKLLIFSLWIILFSVSYHFTNNLINEINENDNISNNEKCNEIIPKINDNIIIHKDFCKVGQGAERTCGTLNPNNWFNGKIKSINGNNLNVNYHITDTYGSGGNQEMKIYLNSDLIRTNNIYLHKKSVEFTNFIPYNECIDQ